MQRDTPYMLQVEVPSDVAAIAIITLHPAGRDAQAQTLHQKRLWAKNVASSVRKQKSSKPLIAYSGADFAHVQVAVPRVKVVITFKALVGLKRRLGFNTSKEDICLQPSGSDMRITMEHMVMQMLKEQGWHSLEKDMLLKTPFLESRQGTVTACAYLSVLDISMSRQNCILLTLQTGMARFRPLSLPLALPGAVDSPADWAHFNDEICSLQITCRLLPNMRPAIVAGMQLVVENEAELRNTWKLHHDMSLPTQVPCYYQLRFSTDPDEATAAVPSCCVWSESGLSTVPHPKASAASDLALGQLAGDLAKSPLCLWPGEQLSFSLLCPQDIASPGQPSPASTWLSAREVSSEPGYSPPCPTPCSIQPLQPVLDDTSPGVLVRPNVAHLGADLSCMLLQLGPSEPDETPSLKIPEMRPSNHQQQALPVPAVQPQPKQMHTPALHQPGSADITLASKSWLKERGPSMQMQTPGESPAMTTPAFQQSSSKDGIMRPCQITLGALETQPQKPAFAKHKRPGPQPLPLAKPPAGRKAAPSGAKKAKKIAAAKASASDPAAAAAAPVAMPMGSVAREGEPTKPKAAQRGRPKAADLDVAQVEAKVMQMWEDGQQSKLSVPELKAFLKARYQLLTGKKADLLERLSSVLSNTGA